MASREKNEVDGCFIVVDDATDLIIMSRHYMQVSHNLACCLFSILRSNEQVANANQDKS